MKDQVLAKIRELCPELMELSFGCEVLLEDMPDFKNYIGIYVGQKFDHETDKFINLCLHPNGNKVYPLDIKYKILGHEPQLQHVLSAIDNSINSWSFSIYANGVMKTTNSNIEVKYDLTKPFAEQSEEVYQFLASVLIK